MDMSILLRRSKKGDIQVHLCSPAKLTNIHLRADRCQEAFFLRSRFHSRKQKILKLITTKHLIHYSGIKVHPVCNHAITKELSFGIVIQGTRISSMRLCNIYKCFLLLHQRKS